MRRTSAADSRKHQLAHRLPGGSISAAKGCSSEAVVNPAAGNRAAEGAAVADSPPTRSLRLASRKLATQPFPAPSRVMPRSREAGAGDARGGRQRYTIFIEFTDANGNEIGMVRPMPQTSAPLWGEMNSTIDQWARVLPESQTADNCEYLTRVNTTGAIGYRPGLHPAKTRH
jgi:hypothetical protein